MTRRRTVADRLPEGITPADVLLAAGMLGFLGSVVLPWLSATDDRIIIGDDAMASMPGYLAMDVLIVTGVVVLAGAAAVGIRAVETDDRYAAAPLAMAAIIVLGMTALYLLDPVLGITEGALADPEVSPGLGVYAGFVAGVCLLTGAVSYALPGLWPESPTYV